MLEELIITKENINEYIDKKYITFNDNILLLLVKVNKLTITYNNIIKIYCSYHNIQELNIEKLTKLEYLDCSWNNLQELNINNLINLKKLDCSNNKLQKLNINNLTNIIFLNCYNNNLQELNLNNLTKLIDLECSHNNLQELNINNLTNLEYLSCKNNNLYKINISKILLDYYNFDDNILLITNKKNDYYKCITEEEYNKVLKKIDELI